MGYHMNDFAGRVARYRQELAEITGAYDKAVQSLDDFKDSASYPAKLGALKAAHTAALDALRAEHRPLLTKPLADMRAEVAKKQGALKLPTAEQIVLLQVLQMRTSVPKSELDRAAKMLEGCPTGLAVLDDIAEKSGHHGCHYNDAPDPDAALQYIDQMESRLSWFLSAERHNAQYVPGNRENPGQNDSFDDIRRIQLTRDFQTAEDCCRVFGVIPSDQMAAFESLVEVQA